MEIEIQGTSYKFAYNWGAVYTYEELTDLPFDPRKHQSLHIMYYAMLLFCNPDTFRLTITEFISELEDIELWHEMDEYFNREMTLRAQQLATNQKKKKQPQKNL